VFTPTAFGRHWRLLMESFEQQARPLDALTVRYEDLVSGRLPLEALESHLGIAIDRTLLGSKVGSSERGGEKAAVSRLERWLLARAAAPLSQRYGYQ
jgi:hypothetical protein